MQPCGPMGMAAFHPSSLIEHSAGLRPQHAAGTGTEGIFHPDSACMPPQPRSHTTARFPFCPPSGHVWLYQRLAPDPGGMAEQGG